MAEKEGRIGDGSLPLDHTESILSGSPQTPPHKLLTSSTGLNSWTILPDERIELLLDSSNEESVARREQEQRLNQEQHDEKHANDRCMGPLDEVQTVGAGAADDISDGISIISDCESTERISPHPFLRDHLNELLHFNDLSTPIVLTTSSSSQAPDQQPEENQLKERRRQNAPNDDDAAAAADDDDDDDESLSNNDKNLMVRQRTSSALSRYQRLPNLVQSGLSAVFYVGVTLAILAFIGKLRHPEWENDTGGSGKSMGNLERRLDDLELQNNLMRAEIDLISKQLQYLSSDQGPTQHQQQQQQQQQGRKAKTFKAWSGNGDADQPMDITKEDLKRPFKCQDGNYVEFAAMCLESKKTTAEHAESLVDEIGNVVNDVLQQSQTFQRFEKVTDRLAASTNGNGNANNGDEIGSDFSKKQQHRQKNINKYSSESTQTRTGSHHQHQHSREEQQSKFYKKQRYAANSKENDSKERYKKKFFKEHDDSDEHRSQQHGKKPRHMSKEDDDDDDDDDDNNNNSGSGEWHQRMMQQREQSRKRNHHKNNNNWFIERGDSREQKRSSETKR